MRQPERCYPRRWTEKRRWSRTLARPLVRHRKITASHGGNCWLWFYQSHTLDHICTDVSLLFAQITPLSFGSTGAQSPPTRSPDGWSSSLSLNSLLSTELDKSMQTLMVSAGVRTVNNVPGSRLEMVAPPEQSYSRTRTILFKWEQFLSKQESLQQNWSNYRTSQAHPSLSLKTA